MKMFLKNFRIPVALLGAILLLYSDRNAEWHLQLSIVGLVLLMLGLYFMQPPHSNKEENLNDQDVQSR